ncbi:glycosyltransferase family 4 protein [Nocardia sp. NPDC051030]|uniref:glycosyltransferase family 4 protein n=1 Tax=Nocardia sp. NPDC051030 TaxID=3155162 RepID=UPI00341C1BCC
MSVVILGINYAPETTGIAPYTTGLARGLAARGHEVRVLTGVTHYPAWRRAAEREAFRTDTDADGVRLRRLNHHVPQHGRGFGRAAMELTFGLQAVTTGWERPDVVICVSPPLLAATMAVARARLTPAAPAVGVLVHDLYSRGVVETGALPGPAAQAMRMLESAAFRHADGVAVIHDGLRDDLVRGLGVERGRIKVIRNWNHVATPDPISSLAFRSARGWSDEEIVVLHAGNMGTKQGLENVVAAAELAARDGLPVRFVLLGDGNQRRRIEAAGAGLPTLEFLPPVSEAEFPSALGAADVLLVNERPGVAQMAVPSKLTSYFTSGRPILAAADPSGYTAQEMTASGGGVLVPADRPDLLLAEAIRIGADPVLGAEFAAAGRRYATALLNPEAALDSYEEWIIELARARGKAVRWPNAH